MRTCMCVVRVREPLREQGAACVRVCCAVCVYANFNSSHDGINLHHEMHIRVLACTQAKP